MTLIVGLFVGSLRAESFTRRVARTIVQHTPKLQFKHIEIGNVSAFNQDLEHSPPPDWVELRDAVRGVDGLLFATPEYNRSVPGVLKNAIDVGSRPYGKSVFAKKPGAVVSVSPGALGGFGANHHLRQTLAFLDVPCLQQPEMYIGNATKLFDESGELVESSRELFAKFGDAFAAWVERNAVRGT